jgi:hypothetical protein
MSRGPDPYRQYLDSSLEARFAEVTYVRLETSIPLSAVASFAPVGKSRTTLKQAS